MLDADVRLARRIRRDTVERGRDVTSVLEQVKLFIIYFYLKVVSFLPWVFLNISTSSGAVSNFLQSMISHFDGSICIMLCIYVRVLIFVFLPVFTF